MDVSTLLHIIIPVVTGIAAFLGGRRERKSKIAETDASTWEKQANTVNILTEVSESMARQLKAFEAEVPVWKKRISEEGARADAAEKYNEHARTIQTQGAAIAEHIGHISYWQAPGEKEDALGKRVREIKEAAAIIERCKLPERMSIVAQVPGFETESGSHS